MCKKELFKKAKELNQPIYDLGNDTYIVCGLVVDAETGLRVIEPLVKEQERCKRILASI